MTSLTFDPLHDTFTLSDDNLIKTFVSVDATVRTLMSSFDLSYPQAREAIGQAVFRKGQDVYLDVIRRIAKTSATPVAVLQSPEFDRTRRAQQIKHLVEFLKSLPEFSVQPEQVTTEHAQELLSEFQINLDVSKLSPEELRLVVGFLAAADNLQGSLKTYVSSLLQTQIR